MAKLNHKLFEQLMIVIDHALCYTACQEMLNESKTSVRFRVASDQIRNVRTQLMTLQQKLSEENENIIEECYNKKGLIPAVKLYRSLTGMSLKDSKEQTEAIIQKYTKKVSESE